MFAAIGLVPNTEWLDGVVERNRFGEIVVDRAKGHTNVPGVFAAGDCTTAAKQIVIAAGEGAKAALSAFDYLIRISGAAGGARGLMGQNPHAGGAWRRPFHFMSLAMSCAMRCAVADGPAGRCCPARPPWHARRWR